MGDALLRPEQFSPAVTVVRGAGVQGGAAGRVDDQKIPENTARPFARQGIQACITMPLPAREFAGKGIVVSGNKTG